MRKLRTQKELECYFNFDAVTGIWNRYYFGIHDAEYRNSEKYPMAALYLSLSGIREINEKQGFSQGDQCIKSFVSVLTAEFGKNACYRMNGNEFVVLLERFEEEDARAEIEAFEELLKAQHMTNVLVGYTWSENSESLEAVVSAAEQDMLLHSKNSQEMYS